MSPGFVIRSAVSVEDVAEVARLFRAYGASLDVDLAYQDFEAELAGLPGAYAAPAGVLLIAHDAAAAPIGCVGLRPGGGEACEMKRLFVAPSGRGLGLGRALMQAAIAAARERGYGEMRLDTLPGMTTAQRLYRQAGFDVIPAYYPTPVEGALFMRLTLRGP